jgi:hypothetical protein
MADILQAVAGIQIKQTFETADFLKNPILAGVYLAIPYLFMIGLDIRSRKALKGKRQLEKIVREVSQTPPQDNDLTNKKEEMSEEEGQSDA